MTGRVPGEEDRRHHEDRRGPGREPGEEIPRAGRAEDRLARAAEDGADVRALPGLQQDDPDQKEARGDVDDRNDETHDEMTSWPAQPARAGETENSTMRVKL